MGNLRKKYKKVRVGGGIYRYYCGAGVYEANSMISLIFEIIKHRTLHLIKDGKWKD